MDLWSLVSLPSYVWRVKQYVRPRTFASDMPTADSTFTKAE